MQALEHCVYCKYVSTLTSFSFCYSPPGFSNVIQRLKVFSRFFPLLCSSVRFGITCKALSVFQRFTARALFAFPSEIVNLSTSQATYSRFTILHSCQTCQSQSLRDLFHLPVLVFFRAFCPAFPVYAPARRFISLHCLALLDGLDGQRLCNVCFSFVDCSIALVYILVKHYFFRNC